MLEVDFGDAVTLAGEFDPEDSPVSTYLASLGSVRTRRTMRSALSSIAAAIAGAEVAPELVPWWRLSRNDMLALRRWLAAKLRPGSANVYLSAVRGVLKEAWLAELIDYERYHRTLAVPPVRHRALPQAAGRRLTAAEIEALVRVCRADASPAGPRDGALIGLLYAGGLRRHEVAELKLDQVDLEDRSVDVVGKGRARRRVYLPDGVCAALDEWLGHRGDASGRLWTRVRRGGHVVRPCTGLTEGGVVDVCARRAKEAGVARFSLHDLRRTCVSNLLDEGVDLATAQRIAGHADPRTTSGYDRRGLRAQREASRTLVYRW